MTQTAQRTWSLAALFLFLCVCLYARSIAESRKHTFPYYDEVTYLDSARAIHDSGGVLRDIRRYFAGTEQTDWHHPLYNFLLATFARTVPRDFTAGKMFAFVQCVVLLAVFLWRVARRWGAGAAAIGATVLAFSAATVEMSHLLLTDTLFALFFLLALTTLLDAEDRLSSWALAGVWIGLAYLTKANGHFLVLSAVALGLVRGGVRFFRRPLFYALLAAFVVTGSFLLVRNARVWGNPLAQVNNKIFWLDAWEYYFFYRVMPVWNDIGLGWYFSTHSVADAVTRFGHGFLQQIKTMLESLSFTMAESGGRLVVGAIVGALGIGGVVRRWRDGHRDEIMAIGAVWLLLFAAFSFFHVQTVRYSYPLVVMFVPFVGVGGRRLLARVPLGRDPEACWRGVAAAALAGTLLVAGFERRAFATHPMTLYDVPASWRQLSDWLEAHVDENGYAIDNWSPFSSWFCCRDKRQPVPFAADERLLRMFIATKRIHTAVVDRAYAERENALFRTKYGASDEFGPTTFLGWPRCYHDDRAPSDFLAYSPTCNPG